MAQLALTLLGPFQATLDGVPIAGFESQKVRALLVYLALEADRPHGRDALAGLLWPDQPDQDARTNLRQALANLRQALGDQRTTPPYVHISGATIQFNRASTHQIDVAVFTELLAAGDQHPHRHPETCTSCARRLQQAVEQYQVDFLASFFLADSAAFEEWALLIRERLHGRAITALGQLAAYHERRGAYAQAQQYARRQLELDPWREESHRQVMRVLALSGQRNAALKQYATCRRILAAELGVEPEEATTVQYARIQRGIDVAAPGVTRAVNNLAVHTPLTPLIGREAELAQLAGRLEDRNCRLLTLVGPGGVGKTRLALQAAADLRTAFRDGVSFVPLAPLRSIESIVPAIADALGLVFLGASDVTKQLLTHLHTKDLLLVLDNLEHLPTIGSLVSEVLATCTDVVVLATSRAPLHVRGEQQFHVPPLRLPDLAHLPDVAALTEYAAVALFVARAQAVQPAFALTAAIAPAIAMICARLDGLPLAIELAAARVKLFPSSALLTRLDNQLTFLTGGARDLPARQQTMRNTIDWSYSLLNAAEQAIFARMGVFVGGCTLAAAEAVLADDRASNADDMTSAIPQRAVLDGLAALVDKSLVKHTEGAEDVARFVLLEPIREYALEQLMTKGEADATQHRHAAYYLALVEAADPHLYRAERHMWLACVEREHHNLRAALTWALTGGDAEIGGRLAVALAGSGEGGSFWSARDPSEATRWLEAVLAQRSAVSPAIRARALLRTANSAWQPQDEQGRAQACAEALTLFQSVGDESGIAATLREQGLSAESRGDSVQAVQYYEASLALYRELSDRHGIATTLHSLGDIVRKQGDTARAMALLEESLALCQEQGFIVLGPWILCTLGDVAYAQGDYARATALFWEAVTFFQQAGDKWNILAPLHGLALAQGDDGRVRVLLEEQVGWFRNEATPIGLAHVLHVLGAVVNAQGDATQATALLREALILQQQFGRLDLIVESLLQCAGVAVEQGQPEQAARLLGATEALRANGYLLRYSAEQAAYNHMCAALRVQLDEAIFIAAWAKGRAMTMEQAITEALRIVQ